MADTRIYLGRPGSLAAIRSPKGSVASNRQRRVTTFELGVGGNAVDQMVGGSRTYVIGYEMLTREDWAILDAYAQGHEGPGPFAFLDPGQRNMLPANISAATSVTNSTDGFALTGNDLISDTFTRTVSNGWGSTDTGQAWTILTGAASEFDTTGTIGRMGFAAVNATRQISIANTGVDFDLTTANLISVVLTGGGASSENSIRARYVDSSNFVELRLTRTAPSTVTLGIRQRVTGVDTSSSTVAVPGVGINSIVRLHFTGVGASLQGVAWLDGDDEPATPLVTLTTTHLTAGGVNLLSTMNASVTNTPPIQTAWDDFVVQYTASALTSDSTYSDAGPRTLAWTVNNSEGGSTPPAIGVDWPSSVFPYGVPVVAARALCFSCYVRGGGTDAIVTYTPRIIWRDITGATVSTTSGTPVASASGAWAQMLVTGTPPATTVYADVDVQCTSGMSIGSIGYFRRFMLNEGSTPDTTWMPGTGVWPVRFGELPDAWPYLSPELRDRPSVALIEDVT